MRKAYMRSTSAAQNCICLLLIIGTNCWGQAPPSDGKHSPPAGVPQVESELVEKPSAERSQTGPYTALQGGASLANFSELMRLIQQSIAPDDWIDGSSVMAPFPSGVFIDSAGQLKQLTPATKPFPGLRAALTNGTQPAWKMASPLRIVSLRKLDQAVGAILQRRGRISQELQQLAGLNRIDYVRVDVVNEDVWLAGPALDRRVAVPQGFYLADLGLLVDCIGSHSKPLGCSIDPTDAGILAAQQQLTTAGALKRLAHNPKKFVAELQDKVGAHSASVFGLPAGAPAGLALLLADEHMKRLGFETIDTTVAVESYFAHLDKQAQVPQQSLVRWWFAYANQPIRADQRASIYQLPEQSVALYSEQQWVGLNGRVPTGKQDAAAEAFAQGLTDALPQLRRADANYARLTALFETALALQLAVEANGQPNLHAWFPNLKQYGQATCDARMEPKTVTGLTACRKLKQGTVVAVVSGGVLLNTKSLAASDRWQSASIQVDLPPEPLSSDPLHDRWWWQ